MSQEDRDRLVVLRKVADKTITQKQAGEELGITIRHIRRLVKKLKLEGDRVVIHGLRGRPSNRRLSQSRRAEIIGILSAPVMQDSGRRWLPSIWRRNIKMVVGRETVRKLMIEAKLWQSRKRRVETAHTWRPRRSRFGELVQWDTSDHDWLEGRGSRLKLIRLIDDATSQKPAGRGTGLARVVTNADRTRVAGAANCLDSGAFAPSQGASREKLCYRSGPLGKGTARGGRVYARGCERVPGKRIRALVGSGGRRAGGTPTVLSSRPWYRGLSPLRLQDLSLSGEHAQRRR